METKKLVPIKDIEILKQYRDWLISEGITLGRVGKYLSDLKKTSLLLEKRFKDADEQDIRRIITIFDGNEKLSPWSKRDFKVAIRKFYTWLRGTKEYPPEVAWMKVYKKVLNAKTHEDLLSEDEVMKMISYARSVQERAFIATLYESGCRLGEIIYIKMGHIKFDNYGAQLYVTGKTGFRRIRIITAVPYLIEWINKHPGKNDPDAYLWLNSRLKPHEYGTIRSLLYRTAGYAGIKKRVNPHNFRHSRATYLANHLTEAQMKEFFGWTQDSKMAGVYVHLSGRDVDNALLKVYGIKNDTENEVSKFKSKDCNRCGEANQATNKICSKCGIPLDAESKVDAIKTALERKEADGIMDSLLEDQEFRAMLIRKVETMKNHS